MNVGIEARPANRLSIDCLLTLRGVILALMLNAVLCSGMSRWLIGPAQIPFEGAAWRQDSPSPGQRSVRSRMVDDLVQRHDFRGWTRAQLVELLGAPAPPECFAEIGNEWDVIYLLGLERGGPFSLDNEFLVFRLDENKRIIEFRTTVD